MDLTSQHPVLTGDAGRVIPRHPTRSSRAPLDPVDTAVLVALLGAVAGFAVYGFTTGAPSTVSYVCTVSVAIALAVRWRPADVPRALPIGLAAFAVAHLAGGLVRVGDDVLYNASIGAKAVQYDHFVHASGVFLGVLVLWTCLVQSRGAVGHRPILVGLCVIAGLGLGAINETVEFATTIAHNGSHVGGYTNTGWDLVSNVVGAAAAGFCIDRQCAAGRLPATTAA